MLVLTCRFLLYFIYNLLSQVIEGFSEERLKTKTKVITQANHDRGKQCNEPIRIQSKYVELAPSAGKHVTVGFGFASQTEHIKANQCKCEITFHTQ